MSGGTGEEPLTGVRRKPGHTSGVKNSTEVMGDVTWEDCDKQDGQPTVVHFDL